MPEVDAVVAEQVVRRLRLWMRLEIRRRTNDGRAMVFGHTHGNHVLLNIFAEVNPCIEAPGNNIDAPVVGGYFEKDVRIIARELRQFWSNNGRTRKTWHDKPHASGRLVAQAGKLVKGILDVRERRAQPHQQLLTCLGRRDAARRPREQPHS